MEISPLHFGLMFVAGVVPFVLIYIFIKNFQRRRRVEFARLAAKRGWTSETPIGGAVLYHLKGTTNGISWELQGWRRHGRTTKFSSSRRPAITLWTTGSVPLPQQVVVVFPIPREKSFKERISENIIDQYILPLVLRHFLGDEQNRLQNIRAVEVGSAQFRENCVVLSDDSIAASAFLSEERQILLMQWGMKAVVTYWQEGLQIKFGEKIDDFAQLDSLVNFGARLAKMF